MAVRHNLKTAGRASVHLRYTTCMCCHHVASLQGPTQLQAADVESVTMWLVCRCGEPAYHPRCDLLPTTLHYSPLRHVPTSSCCQVAVHAYRIFLEELPLPDKGLNQEHVDKNRIASLPWACMMLAAFS
ncbi:TPA: hypothetical protein ACH3X2_008167 [Trebouxia sp. C0005]